MKSLNPFPKNSDRFSIWKMLVEEDSKAFAKGDWKKIKDHFIKNEFIGLDAGYKSNPEFWKLRFPTLKSYKSEWLRQSKSLRNASLEEDFENAILRSSILTDIDINGTGAIAHKKFNGHIKAHGKKISLNWQTLYRCKKVNQTWKITGFIGYLPNSSDSHSTNQIIIPESSQHVTAGPYSPVLEIQSNKFVVISGQAAIDKRGNVVGETIEEQAKKTLENCKVQLANAGVTFDDVFKVNVYLTDLKLWPRFNEVYKTFFSKPLPVRAAVGTSLLMTLLVEIEMWAIKK